MSGVKHVISSVVDHDALTNSCTGTGRLKLRLTEAEDLDAVKLKFIKEGYAIQEHDDNPKKKSNFTAEMKL